MSYTSVLKSLFNLLFTIADNNFVLSSLVALDSSSNFVAFSSNLDKLIKYVKQNESKLKEFISENIGEIAKESYRRLETDEELKRKIMIIIKKIDEKS